MKILGLLRHAKSEHHQPSGLDYDRGLNAKGRRAANAMGRHMGSRPPRFDRIIASPAARVTETLDLVLDAMGRAAPVDRVADRRLYLAPAEVLAEVAAELGGAADSLLLVAHNPGVENFVLDHVPDDGSNSLREIVATKYPTGAFAVLEFAIDDWDELPHAKGRIVSLVRPRDLDPSLGPELVD